MQIKILKITFLSFFLVLLTGCNALFIEKSIPKPEPLSMAQYKQKPNVFIKVRAIHGTPEHVRTARPMWDEYIRNKVARIVRESQLFNYVTFDEEDINIVGSAFDRPNEKVKRKIDYRIEVAYFEEIDYDQVGWSAVKSVFTLGLIPFYYDRYVNVTLRVYDNDNKLLESDRNSVSARNWRSTWLLPLSFFYTESDLNEQVNNQVETLLFNAVKQNTFEYEL